MAGSDELECIGMVQGLEARGLVSYQCKVGGAPRYLFTYNDLLS